MKQFIASLAMLCSITAVAQTLTITVPHPPGNAPDALARILERHLTDSLKRPVVVVNRTGADGRIGVDFVATSTGNNHVLLASTGPFLFNRVVYSKLNYSYENFDSMVPIARIPISFSVHPAVPVRNFNDLLKLSQQRPIICAGSSASSFFLGKFIMDQLQISNVVWVPFKGSADMNVQLMAGNIDCGLDTSLGHLPLHASGRIRIVAVSTVDKYPLLPDAIVLRDVIPGLSFYNWYGIAVPKSFDPQERDKIFAALKTILSNPGYQDSVTKSNLELVTTPADSANWLHNEYNRWEAIRQRLRIPKID